MKTPLLVIDVSYLCHRAFHSTQQELSFRGKATGVVFGFLKSITFLKDEFQTDRVAFCFEHPHLFRRDLFPAYKRRRQTQERTPEEKESYAAMAIQVANLRQRYLPKIGFKNIFCFRGMESDDIMAAIARDAGDKEEVIIVTSDGDLFQCLRPNVTIYSPQKRQLFTLDWFQRTYGIHPRKWAVVKAIAGCHSDEVPGIRGVGEKTALRFVAGTLPETSKAYQTITDEPGLEIVRHNRPLVQLPFAGCPSPKIRQDKVTKQSWIDTCSELGMRSIAGRPPIATRKLMRL